MLLPTLVTQTLHIDGRFICDGFNMYRQTVETDRGFDNFVRHIEAVSLKPPRFAPPPNHLSTRVRNLVGSRAFRGVPMLCVLLNVCFLLADHADATADFDRLMQRQNLAFFTELVVEVVLGLVGFGPLGYFQVRGG